MTDDKKTRQTRTTRRAMLRGLGAAGVGGMAVGAVPEPASAARNVRLSRREWKSPTIDGYHYGFSVHAEDICYWISDICVPVGVVNLGAMTGARMGIWKVPQALVVAGVFCTVSGSHCYVARKIRESTDGQHGEWFHVHARGYWLSKLGKHFFPHYLIVPFDKEHTQ